MVRRHARRFFAKNPLKIRFNRLPGLARELAGLPVDMFVVRGEDSIRAAMQERGAIGDPLQPPFLIPSPDAYCEDYGGSRRGTKK